MRAGFSKSIVAVMAGLTLAVTLSRCSPLAPSIPKIGFGPAGGPPAIAPLPEQTGPRIPTFETVLLDSGTFTDALRLAPTENTFDLTGKELDTFLNSRSVEVSLEGGPLENGACVLEFKNLATLNDLDLGPIETTLTKNERGKWTLTVVSDVTDEDWSYVQLNLVSVSLVLKGTFAAVPTPSATPSAAPSAAPSAVPSMLPAFAPMMLTEPLPGSLPPVSLAPTVSAEGL